MVTALPRIEKEAMPIILITGGARSGKSLRAETRALTLPGRPIYIATAEPFDDEMRTRIAEHCARRKADWDELEVPLDLAAALERSDGAGVRLVDCLTIWLSNIMHAGRNVELETTHLSEALTRQTSPVILVTNEVGLGIVPDNALARAFRDAAGRLNQKIAQVADEVEFVVAGLAVKIK